MAHRLCLKNPLGGPCPPDGYRWTDTTDGYVSHAWDYRTWVEQAEKHLRCNGREIPADLGEQMQEQLCLQLPPGWCDYDDPNRPRPSYTMEWNDIASGLQTFARWITGGCQFVAQSESNRRALICSRCYLNQQVSGCAACKRAVEEVIGSHATKYDFALKGCGVCRCMLRAKVHFPIETLDTETDKLQALYPDFCWLKKGGSNYGDPDPAIPD